MTCSRMICRYMSAPLIDALSEYALETLIGQRGRQGVLQMDVGTWVRLRTTRLGNG